MQFWRHDQRLSYQEVFGYPDKVPTRSQATVLQDLRRFCFADKRTSQRGRDGNIDAIATALLEGRREVWLRLRRFVDMSDQQLDIIEKMELDQRATLEHRAEEEGPYAA